jgi:hypothetical protein
VIRPIQRPELSHLRPGFRHRQHHQQRADPTGDHGCYRAKQGSRRLNNRMVSTLRKKAGKGIS